MGRPGKRPSRPRSTEPPWVPPRAPQEHPKAPQDVFEGPTLYWGITNGVGVQGDGVILVWDLNIAKFQTAITRHHWL